MSEDASSGSPSRRVAGLGVLLILLVLAVLVWQAREAGTDDEPPPAAERAAAAPPQRPSLAEMLSRFEGLAPPALAAVSPVAPAASAPRDRAEVCGLGSLKIDAAGQFEEPERLEQPLRQARERMLVALANSPDEAERAAGLYVQSFGPAAAVFPSKDEPLPEEVPAAGAGVPMVAAQAAVARDALASMAAHTGSAQVYAVALNACARSPREGACALLSSAQWARLDPRNAAPWLQIAGEASARGDEAGVSEALFNVANSSSNDGRTTPLVTMAMARVPADAPPYVRVTLGGEMLGRSMAGMNPYQALMGHCSKPAMADANRQQACQAVAEVLTTRDGSRIEFVVGLSIGERAGWTADRLQALRDERDALRELSAKALDPEANLFGCATQQRYARYFSEVGAHGEMGALRRMLKQSPDSVAVLARRHQAQQAASEARNSASAPEAKL